MITKILNMIKCYLEETQPYSYKFSIELEDELLSCYDEMKKENQKLTYFLNEDLPDICASYDEDNETEFAEKVKSQYEIALKMYNE